jgi:cytochrome c oxidase subunit IV
VVSTLKALLVLNNFMHLRWEPIPLQVIIYLALFALAALIIGVYFDVTTVPRDVYKG